MAGSLGARNKAPLAKGSTRKAWDASDESALAESISSIKSSFRVFEKVEKNIEHGLRQRRSRLVGIILSSSSQKHSYALRDALTRSLTSRKSAAWLQPDDEDEEALEDDRGCSLQDALRRRCEQAVDLSSTLRRPLLKRSISSASALGSSWQSSEQDVDLSSSLERTLPHPMLSSALNSSLKSSELGGRNRLDVTILEDASWRFDPPTPKPRRTLERS
ncbi:unnamed protein product, partial [Polarella glacialis]